MDLDEANLHSITFLQPPAHFANVQIHKSSSGYRDHNLIVGRMLSYKKAQISKF